MNDDRSFGAPPPVPQPPGVPPAPERPGGYVSERSKKKFTMTAGVLGAVFFIVQFILPFIIAMAVVPGLSLIRMGEMDVPGAVYRDGRVWMLSELPVLGRSSHAGPTTLVSLAPGSSQEPQEVAVLSLDEGSLLAGQDRLWIISPEAVRFHKDGEVSVVYAPRRLADISSPFLYEGDPAVIERGLAGYALQVFDGSEWQEKASFNLALPGGQGPLVENLRAVAAGGIVHLFAKTREGRTLYHRQGLPAEGEDKSDSWEPIASVDGWSAVLLDGRPSVFFTYMTGTENKVVGMKWTDRGWREFFTRPTRSAPDIGICPTGEGEDFVLLLGWGLTGFRVIDVKAGQEVSSVRHGRGLPLHKRFMLMMFIPHLMTYLPPLVLAFILAGLMRKHRVCRYTSGNTAAPFASLSRRAVAQLIDGAILVAPVILAWMDLFSRFEEMESPFEMGFPFGWIFAGLFWALAMLFVYSILEGRWGRTPGKWIVGIQVVGTDLKPCGFGRALVRNLLKFVDGFFNFLVGVLLAALTENWQRLGDMAARTIVIRARRPAEPFPPVQQNTIREVEL